MAVIVLTLVWMLLSLGFSGRLPAPSEVFPSIARIITGHVFLANLLPTLLRVFVGAVCSLFVGGIVGILMGRVAWFKEMFNFLIVVGRGIPGMTWGLIAVVVIGVGNAAPIVAVILTTVPIVAVTFMEIASGHDRALDMMSRVFKIGLLDRLRQVIVPEISGAIAAGIRTSIAFAWQVTIIVEMFGLSHGVGYQLNNDFSVGNTIDVMAWAVIMIIVITLVDLVIISPTEEYLGRWKPQARLAF